MPERKETIEPKSVNNTERPVESGKPVETIPRREGQVPKEVETWMEVMEKRPSVNVHDDKTGQTVLQVSDQTDDSYQLPTTRPKFIGGFKESVENVARWFSVFVLKVIKKKEGKVKFRQEDE